MQTPLEHILLTAYKPQMVAFMQTHPEHFPEAISLALSNKQPLAWRAAWLLHDCIEYNDPLVLPVVTQIIDAIPEKRDGHQRELIKILMKMELDEDQEGRMVDTCITIWEKNMNSSSARYTAFIYLIKTAEKYPELSNEIAFFAQAHYFEALSPGIKNSLITKTNKLLHGIEKTKAKPHRY